MDQASGWVTPEPPHPAKDPHTTGNAPRDSTDVRVKSWQHERVGTKVRLGASGAGGRGPPPHAARTAVN